MKTRRLLLRTVAVAGFSTPWKIFFHGVENREHIFHSVENE